MGGGKLAEKLTDRIIAKLLGPAAGQTQIIHFDSDVGGLGVRITASGVRSFILDYRTTGGRQRRYTVGRVGEWSIGAARAEARELKQQIAQGGDPMGERRSTREAPSVADLAQRFTEEHLPKKRPITQRDYRLIINTQILPRLGAIKVADVTFADVDALHRRITKGGATFQANRTIAVLSKMMSFAVRLAYHT